MSQSQETVRQVWTTTAFRRFENNLRELNYTGIKSLEQKSRAALFRLLDVLGGVATFLILARLFGYQFYPDDTRYYIFIILVLLFLYFVSKAAGGYVERRLPWEMVTLQKFQETYSVNASGKLLDKVDELRSEMTYEGLRICVLRLNPYLHVAIHMGEHAVPAVILAGNQCEMIVYPPQPT
jgi:hypothetical protein